MITTFAIRLTRQRVVLCVLPLLVLDFFLSRCCCCVMAIIIWSIRMLPCGCCWLFHQRKLSMPLTTTSEWFLPPKHHECIITPPISITIIERIDIRSIRSWLLLFKLEVHHRHQRDSNYCSGRHNIPHEHCSSSILHSAANNITTMCSWAVVATVNHMRKRRN